MTVPRPSLIVSMLAAGTVLAALALAQQPGSAGTKLPEIGRVDARLNAEFQSALVPVGGVVAFWGTLKQIEEMENFELCDGTPASKPGAILKGNKPNLHERFVMGAEAGTKSVVGESSVSGGNNKSEPIDVGSTEPTSLTVDQLPPHDHTGWTIDQDYKGPILDNYHMVRLGYHWTPKTGSEDTKVPATHIVASTKHAEPTFRPTVPNLPVHKHRIATEGKGEGHTHKLPAIPPRDQRPAFQAMYYIIRVR